MKTRKLTAVMLAFAMVLSVSCVNVAAANDGENSETFTVTSDEAGTYWVQKSFTKLDTSSLTANDTITFTCDGSKFRIGYSKSGGYDWTNTDESTEGVVALDLADVNLGAGISIIFTSGQAGTFTVTWTVAPTESGTDPDEPDQPDEPDEPGEKNSATFTVSDDNSVWYAQFNIKEHLDPSDLVATNTITFSCAETNNITCAYTSTAGEWTQIKSPVLDLADVNLDNDIFIILSPGVAGVFTVTWTVAPTESGTDPDQPDPDEPDPDQPDPDQPGDENSATVTVSGDNVWYAQFSIKEHLDPNDLVATNTITFSCAETNNITCAYTSTAGEWTQTKSPVLDLADVNLDNDIFIILSPGVAGVFTVTWTVAPTESGTDPDQPDEPSYGNSATFTVSEGGEWWSSFSLKDYLNPDDLKAENTIIFSCADDAFEITYLHVDTEEWTESKSENGVVALDLAEVDLNADISVVFTGGVAGELTITWTVTPTATIPDQPDPDQPDPDQPDPDQPDPDQPSYGNSATFTVSEGGEWWSSFSLKDYLNPDDLKAENTIIFSCADDAFEITYLHVDTEEWIESKSENGVVALDLAEVDLNADISVVFTGGVAGELTVSWEVVPTADYEPPVEPKPETRKNCATFDVIESEAYWSSFSLSGYLPDSLTEKDTITFISDVDFEITYIKNESEWTESKSSGNYSVTLPLMNVNLGADISVVFTGGVYGSLSVSWTVTRANKPLDFEKGTEVEIEGKTGKQFDVVENELLASSDLDSKNTVTFTCDKSNFWIAYTPKNEVATVSAKGLAVPVFAKAAPLAGSLAKIASTGDLKTIPSSEDGTVTLNLAKVDTEQPINIIFPADKVSEGSELTVTCSVAATNKPYSNATSIDYNNVGGDGDYSGGGEYSGPYTDAASSVAPADPVFDGKSSAIFTVSDDEVWWAQFSINAYLNSDDLKPENIITFTCTGSEFKIAYIDKADEWTTIDSVGGVLALDLSTVNLGADISVVFSTGNAGRYTVSWKAAANPNYKPGNDSQSGDGAKSVAPADPVFDGKSSAVFTVSDDEVWWAQFSVNAYLNPDDLKAENIITFTCADSEFKIAYTDNTGEWATVDSTNGVLALELSSVNLGADISVVFSTGNAGKYSVSWKAAANPNYKPGTDKPQSGESTAPAAPVFDGKSSATFTVSDSDVWWAQFSLNAYLDPDDLKPENIITFTCADSEFKIAYIDSSDEWTTVDSEGGVLAFKLANVNLYADISVVFASGNAGKFKLSWAVAADPNYVPGDDSPSGEGKAPVFDGKNSAVFTVGESEAWWAQFSLNEYLAYIDLAEENTVTFTCADAAFLIAYTNNAGEWSTIEASSGVVALDLADVDLFADIFLVFTGGVAGEFTASWTVAPTEGGADFDQTEPDDTQTEPDDTQTEPEDTQTEPDTSSDPMDDADQADGNSHLGLWITLAVILVAAAAAAVTFIVLRKRKAAPKETTDINN